MAKKKKKGGKKTAKPKTKKHAKKKAALKKKAVKKHRLKKPAKKPKPKKKPVKKPKRKPSKRSRVVREPVIPLAKIDAIISQAVKRTSSAPTSDGLIPDEEIALRAVNLYFQQVARLGLKRSLDLDEVINAYFYSLARVKRKDFEIKEIVEAVKKSKLKKDGF